MEDSQVFSEEGFLPDIGSWYKQSYLSPQLQRLKSVELGNGETIRLIRARHPDHEVRNPAIDSYSLYLATRGSITAKVDLGVGLTETQIQPGTISLARAGAETYFKGNGVHEIIAFNIPKSYLDDLLNPEDQENWLSLHSLYQQPFQDPLAAQTIMTLWREMTQSPALERVYFEGVLQMIAARLVQIANPTTFNGDEGELNMDARIDQVVDYIRHNLSASLTLEELAHIACCSPFHLARIFRRRLGKTVHGYVLEKRLDMVQQRLGDGNTSIAEIAAKSGFSSQSHMTSAFKRQFGTTPAAYRREKRGR